MTAPSPAPLPELFSAREPAGVSALWAQAHPLGPCAGDPSPAPADAWGIESGGELLAVGALRAWGRVGMVHGVAVADRARGRGYGAALLSELVRELQSRDCDVIGMEVDAAGAGALTALARAGFKPMQLSFILEGPLAAPDSAAGDAGVREAGEGAGREAGEGAVSVAGEAAGTGAAESAQPVLLQGAAGAEHAGLARAVATSVDASLDPSSWLAERLRKGEAEALVVPREGQPAALAVLPVTGGGDALAVSMLLCAEGPPRRVLPEVLAALGALARSRGLQRLQVAAPSRYWEATRALIDMGFRPRASLLRLTQKGFPERADPGRTCLAAWR